MKFVFAGAAAVLLFSAGCATQEGVTMAAAGKADAPNVNVKDNKPQQFMVGSRIARETRGSAESVKSIGRKEYQETRQEKSPSPLFGGG